MDRRIVKFGKMSLAKKIEESGYQSLQNVIAIRQQPEKQSNVSYTSYAVL